MTKEQFLNRWWPACTTTFIDDLDALIATEIAKAKEANEIKNNFYFNKQVMNPYETGSQSYTAYEKGFIDGYNKSNEIAKVQEVKPTEQPEMTEKEKIDHILTNKLTWKPMGNNRFYANMIGGKSSEGSRQVCFVDYNNPHSGYFETRIFKIDLSEWQPVEAEQPSSQGKLDNSFDKDRFEAMFRAVVASGRTERWEQDFKFTEEALAKLDAYYAKKEKGGNNG